MAETVQFRSGVLRHFVSQDGESGPFVRAHWTVDFANPAMEAMGWKDPGDCGVIGADLAGEIASANVVITPHSPELAKHEIQFDCHEATDFKLFVVKDGDSRRREVRFVIRSNVRGVAAMLEDYRWNVGDQGAVVKLSYVKQETLDLGSNGSATSESTAADEELAANLARAEQGPATEQQFLEEFGPEDGPCISCNNRLPFEDAEHTTHVNGSKCARSAGATLASAVTAGGTHQRGTRGRRRAFAMVDPDPVKNDGIQEVEEDEPAIQ